MFGNESKTQAETLKMKPYAEFLRQFNTLKDVGGETVHIRIASDNIAWNEYKVIGGFELNRTYTRWYDLRFVFRTVLDKKDDLQQEKFFVYHELLTEFDEEFRDCLTDMAEDIRKKQGCMFISSLAKSCEVEAVVKAKNRFSLSYEVGCEKENAREICLQLISHDVAIFARSF